MKKGMIAFLLAAFCLTGCSAQSDSVGKIQDLEFTVLSDEEAPDTLRQLIEQKKDTNFKLTYTEAGYLYIAVGYGAKDTGGYSISVKELYLTENTVCIKTELLGPGKEEEPAAGVSYPYIIIKLEDRNMPVTFQ